MHPKWQRPTSHSTRIFKRIIRFFSLVLKSLFRCRQSRTAVEMESIVHRTDRNYPALINFTHGFLLQLYIKGRLRGASVLPGIRRLLKGLQMTQFSSFSGALVPSYAFVVILAVVVCSKESFPGDLCSLLSGLGSARIRNPCAPPCSWVLLAVLEGFV